MHSDHYSQSYDSCNLAGEPDVVFNPRRNDSSVIGLIGSLRINCIDRILEYMYVNGKDRVASPTEYCRNAPRSQSRRGPTAGFNWRIGVKGWRFRGKETARPLAR